MFRVAAVVAVLVTVHLLLAVDGCGGVGVCCCGCCWFPIVGCAHVLMCCDAGALRCGAGCSWVSLGTPRKLIISFST